MNNLLLENKTITITGGTGSFGKTVLKYLTNQNLKEIRVFSRDESKQDLLRKEINNPKVKFYIGDIRSKDSLKECISGSNFIFHAAALKQVPSCEFFPFEAVKTNIIGSQNVISVAKDCNVEKTILLSTDKAAMPINAMGISKSMMEKLAISEGLKNPDLFNKFIVTRYGNVMGSRGSVIPLFIEKLLKNETLPVTDPMMTRFMMSLEDSVNLVLFALTNGGQGDLLVQKASSATVETLIESLELIFNKKAKTKLIGFRHSEKKHETLLTEEEASRSEDLKDFYLVKPDNRSLNYSSNSISLEKNTEFNSNNAKQLDSVALNDLLLKQHFMKKYLK
jgi:UDP-N-acetylglucosamine 4,6-dehydratase